MSDSDRGRFSKAIADNGKPIAILVMGLIVSAYLFWRLQPEQPYLPRYQPTDAKANGYQAGGRDCSPQALAAIRNIRERAAKSDDCADKAEDYRMKADDLIQQTRAADGAQSQARSAYEQGWLALWATLGGLWTLIAAGMAAVYARDAARVGRRSAKAAEKNLTAYKEAERPRLIMEVNPPVITADAMTFELVVQNIGRSSTVLSMVEWGVFSDRKFPDRNKVIAELNEVDLVRQLQLDDFFCDCAPHNGLRVILPNTPLRLPMPVGKEEALRSRFIIGRICYDGMERRSHVDHFCYGFSPIIGADPQIGPFKMNNLMGKNDHPKEI